MPGGRCFVQNCENVKNDELGISILFIIVLVDRQDLPERRVVKTADAKLFIISVSVKGTDFGKVYVNGKKSFRKQLKQKSTDYEELKTQ